MLCPNRNICLDYTTALCFYRKAMRTYSAPDVDFGRRMKAARKRKGLTLKGASRLLGIEYSSLSRYENGLRSFTLHAALRVASALGFSLRGISATPTKRAIDGARRATP